MSLSKLSYRVREVPRYEVVSDYEKANGVVGAAFKGIYETREEAEIAAHALCRDEHERLGWPLDDPRVQYPPAAEVQP